MQRIETSWDELVVLVEQVQDARGLTQVGPDGWTVKDHLSHIAAWAYEHHAEHMGWISQLISESSAAR